MASSISILTDIVDFSPVYNRQEIYVYETDAATQALTDFAYIIDVYIEGQTFGGVGFKRYNPPPDPVAGIGVVDIGPMCESFCSSTPMGHDSVFAVVFGATADGKQSIIKVTVKYGYSYSLAGVYTVVADTVVGSAKYLFSGSLTEFELMGWTPNDYLCNVANGASAQFLTDMKTNKVSISNLGAHHILSDTPTEVDYVQYKTYTSAGVLIQTVHAKTLASQAATASRNFAIATGPQSLNNIATTYGPFTQITLGSQPIITSSVDNYTVQLFDVSNVPVSEILYFEIEEPCRYTQRRISFENTLASFDAYNFNLRSQKEEEVSRTSYKKNKYPLNSSGQNRLYQDASQVVNYVETQEFLTVRSDYLTTAENDWLRQLVSSPEIYLEITDHTGVQNFIAYEMVTNNSWVEKETEIDKLWIMELKLKLSQTNSRQRR